jgi:hypothetical protein
VSAKFAFIAAEKADPTSPYPVTSMCRWLRVSTSGFYDYGNAVETDRARRRAKLISHVQAAFTLGRGAYGVRRVHGVLARSHDPEVGSCSAKLVRSIMAELGLKACQPRAFKTTTQAYPAAGGPADLLGRDFTAEQPGTKLVGDITYLATGEGWLYLLVTWNQAAWLRPARRRQDEHDRDAAEVAGVGSARPCRRVVAGMGRHRPGTSHHRRLCQGTGRVPAFM